MWDGERFRFGIEWREPLAQNARLPAVPYPPFAKCAKDTHFVVVSGNSKTRATRPKAEAAAHALKGVLKDSSAPVGREQGTAVVTTEGDEMALPGVLITRKAPRHEFSVAC
jgi:hypothetical protein